MDAVFGGVLFGVTFAAAVVYWQLLVRPEVVLSLWHGRAQDGWFEDQHPVALSALRWVAGGLVVLLGFLTGLVWMFLGSTA